MVFVSSILAVAGATTPQVFDETAAFTLPDAKLAYSRSKRAAEALCQAAFRERKVPVVIVNPTEIAIALKYDASVSAAPMVVAMGRRKIAERIRAIATKSGVPIVENRPVARALIATAAVGKSIPPALYAAVAEILAFVYRKRGRLPNSLVAPLRGDG